MKSEITSNLEIAKIGATSANNRYPSFIGANSEYGVTVTKPLHEKVFEEVNFMFVMRLNQHTFSTDNHLTNSGVKILNPFTEGSLDFSNKYEVRRKGNTFYIQKINGKGKVFQFALHVSVEKGTLQYRYVWKKKLKKFIDGYRVKMRMYASHQLGINPSKLYTVAA